MGWTTKYIESAVHFLIQWKTVLFSSLTLCRWCNHVFSGGFFNQYWRKNVQIDFKSESQSLIWVLFRGLTILNDQLDVDLVIIEPARDLHPAAVLPTITPPSV